MSDILRYTSTSMWKSAYTCVNCFREFGNKLSSRPILISCGHTLCQLCVSSSKELICKCCNTSMEIPNETHFKRVLEENYFISGFLSYRESWLKYDIDKIVSTKRESESEQSEESDLGQKPCIECKNLSSFYCPKCDDAFYCEMCFDNIHKTGVIFKQHKRLNISPFTAIQECEQHNKIQNQYCLTCNQPLCEYCCREHLDHQLVSLSEANERVVENIGDANSIIDSIDDQIIISNSKLRKYKKSLTQQVNLTIKKVSEFYSQLHGVLQNEEYLLLTKIKQKIEESTGKVDNYITIMSKNRKKLAQKKTKLDQLQKDVPDGCDATAIVNQIQAECKQLPANFELTTEPPSIFNIKFKSLEVFKMQMKELASVKFLPSDLPPLNKARERIPISNISVTQSQFIANSDQRSNVVAKHRKIAPPKKQSHSSDTQMSRKLSSANNTNRHLLQLENNVVSPNISLNRSNALWKMPEELSVQMWKPCSAVKKYQPVSVSSSSCTGNRNPQRQQKSLPRLMPPKNSSGCNQFRKYPSSPPCLQENVFVVYVEDPSYFSVQLVECKEIWSDMLARCNKAADNSETPDNIFEEACYLIWYEESWHRGKVLAQLDTDMFNVRLMDRGDVQEISKTSFRHIPEDLMTIPSVNICQIFGLTPLDENWSPEAIDFVKEVISLNNVILLKIKSNVIQYTDEDIIQVDLIVTKHERTFSVRDALHTNNYALYKEFPACYNAIFEKKQEIVLKDKRKYQQDIIDVGAYIQVIVTHVESPAFFYAISSDDEENYNYQTNRLNEVYQSKNCEMIYVQHKGMVCAINDGQDWVRGCIEDMGNNGIRDVMLVDKGRVIKSKWHHLRYLTNDFMDLCKQATKFKLADVEPIDGNEYSEECKKVFKKICKSKFITVHVHRSGTFNEVTMSTVSDQQEININSELVQIGFAKPTGVGSIAKQNVSEKVASWLCDYRKSQNETDTNEETDSDSMKRDIVVIKHFVNPSEIYFQFAKREKEIKRIDDKLQQHITNLRLLGEMDANVQAEWTVGSYCCIRAELLEKHSFWYRGLVLCKNALTYTVFLLDIGQTLTDVLSNQMAPIDEKLAKIQQGVVRCHLALQNPLAHNNGDWTKTASEIFIEYIKRFEVIAVTADEKHEDGQSFGMTFWGRRIVKAGALSSPGHDWVNINDYLVHMGLSKPDNQHLSVNGSTEESMYSRIGTDYSAKQAKIMIDAYKLQSEREEQHIKVKSLRSSEKLVYDLESWIPAAQINLSSFNAYVTCVDSNLVFFLHHSDQKEIIDKMKIRINEIAKPISNPENTSWRVGQPCLAKFVDNNYYRAEIRSVNSARQTCNVEFIDYGDIADCAFQDIKNMTMYADIPKQATSYYFANFIPVSVENGQWSSDAISYCFEACVTKLCCIRTNPGYDPAANPGPVPFEIHPPEHADLRVELLMQKFGAYMFPDRKIPKLNEKDKNQKPKQSPIERSSSIINLDLLAGIEDYKKLFEKSVGYEEQEKNQKDQSTSDGEESCCFFGDCDKQNKSKKIMGGAGISDVMDSSEMGKSNFSGSFESEDFEDDVLHCIKNYFKLFRVEKGISGLNVQIKKIVNSTNFIVTPTDHRAGDYKKMIQMIQIAGKSLPPMQKITVNTVCLAFSKVHKEWHRAVVLELNTNEDTANVVLVDFMEEDTVSLSFIRKCSSRYRQTPVNIFPVKLYGIKRNRRMRTADILRRLDEIMPINSLFYAEIVEVDVIPEVNFYQSLCNTNQVVYEPMCNERYFKRI